MRNLLPAWRGGRGPRRRRQASSPLRRHLTQAHREGSGLPPSAPGPTTRLAGRSAGNRPRRRWTPSPGGGSGPRQSRWARRRAETQRRRRRPHAGPGRPLSMPAVRNRPRWPRLPVPRVGIAPAALLDRGWQRLPLLRLPPLLSLPLLRRSLRLDRLSDRAPPLLPVWARHRQRATAMRRAEPALAPGAAGGAGCLSQRLRRRRSRRHLGDRWQAKAPLRPQPLQLGGLGGQARPGRSPPQRRRRRVRGDGSEPPASAPRRAGGAARRPIADAAAAPMAS